MERAEVIRKVFRRLMCQQLRVRVKIVLGNSTGYQPMFDSVSGVSRQNESFSVSGVRKNCLKCAQERTMEGTNVQFQGLRITECIYSCSIFVGNFIDEPVKKLNLRPV